DGYAFAKRIATGHPDDYGLLFRKGDELRLAVWTTANDPHPLRMPSADCRFEVITHTGERRDPVSATDGVLTLTVSDAPQYLIAKQPNRMLADAPVAHDLRATLIPGPGRLVTIQVDNLAERPFQGRVRLTDLSGIEATETEQSLRMNAGETNLSVRFPLAAKPVEQCSVGLRIEDEAGQLMFALPPRRFVFLPEDVWESCRIVVDGDANVASEQSIAVKPTPEPLSDLASGPPVLKIEYRFGEGWKFLRVVTRNGDLPEISGTPKGFGFWVYGDGGHGSPRLRVRDATGQTWQPTGPEIDWSGWRYIELPLNASSGHWGGAEDGVMHPPLVWDSIFLLDNPTRKPVHGAVYLAAPVVVY
ncbi:MAG: hypothetical protein JJ992_17315, partial [Planctomycetes bacterium]|nr:hypothetical protein [Planctomycetota bacterium]